MSKLHKLVAGTAMVTTVAVGFNSLAGADIYTVKSGDTLWDIARNNGTTVEQLMKDNHLTSSLIFPGDQLSFQTVATQVAKAEENGYYKVVLGDTLFKIASKFGTTVDHLVEVNKLSNPNFILVGQSLNVSGVVEAKPEAKAEAPKAAPAKVEEKKVEAPKAAPAKVEEKKAEAPKAAPAKVEEKKVEAPKAAPAKVEEKKVVPAAAPAKVEEKKAEAPKAAPAPAIVASGNKAASIFAAAQAQVGVYQDCTMLVTNALRAVGINFHGWPAGYLSLGTVVPASQAVPGDLIYYANGGMGLAHIAVYAGNGQAIHGGWNGNQTVVNTANVGSGPVFIRVA